MNVKLSDLVIVVIGEPVHVIDVATYIPDDVVRRSGTGRIAPSRLTASMLPPVALANDSVKPVGVPVTPRSSLPDGSADSPLTIVMLRTAGASIIASTAPSGAGAASGIAASSPSGAPSAPGALLKPNRPHAASATSKQPCARYPRMSLDRKVRLFRTAQQRAVDRYTAFRVRQAIALLLYARHPPARASHRSSAVDTPAAAWCAKSKPRSPQKSVYEAFTCGGALCANGDEVPTG
jgi:hypothetical protein